MGSQKMGVLIIVTFLFLAVYVFLDVRGSDIEEYELLWKRKMNSYIEKVDISADGKYIVAAARDTVYLLDRDTVSDVVGILLWKYRFNDYLFRRLDIQLSKNGKYIAVMEFIGSVPYDANFHILNSNREVLFSCNSCLNYGSVSDTGSRVHLTRGELFKPDLVLYYDSPISRTSNWKYEVPNGIKALISSDGNHILILWYDGKYLQSYGKSYPEYRHIIHLTLLDKYGNKKWDYEVMSTYLWCLDCRFIPVSISADGGRIVLDVMNEIRLLDANGHLLTRYKKLDGWGDPVLSPDGNYIVHMVHDKHSSYIIVVNDKGEWRQVTKEKGSSIAVSSNADYIVGSDGYNVYLYARSSIAKVYRARKTIEAVARAINNEMSKGYIVTAAADLLSEARARFRVGDYDGAKSLAEQAYSFAKDIDQDGVPNDEDFHPYINNNQIYIGVTYISVLLIAVLVGYVFSRRRKERIYVFDKETGEFRKLDG
jgi:hypothetical protein